MFKRKLKDSATVFVRFVNSPVTSSYCWWPIPQQEQGVLIMLFFKRKPPLPLDEAFRHIAEAVEILYTYQRDKRYIPTDDDLQQFTEACEALEQAVGTARYIEQCLHQRQAGEPEGGKKFTDSAVFDYHNPP